MVMLEMIVALVNGLLGIPVLVGSVARSAGNALDGLGEAPHRIPRLAAHQPTHPHRLFLLSNYSPIPSVLFISSCVWLSQHIHSHYLPKRSLDYRL